MAGAAGEDARQTAAGTAALLGPRYLGCVLGPCYFRYSESFFSSSGIGGNGGHSWE